MMEWTADRIEATVPKVLKAHYMVQGHPVLIVYMNKDDGLGMCLVVLGGVERSELREFMQVSVAKAKGVYAMFVFPAHATEQDTGEYRYGVMGLLEGAGTQRTYLWEGGESDPVCTLDPKNVQGPMLNFSGLLGQN
jgi:hypothetical protein